MEYQSERIQEEKYLSDVIKTIDDSSKITQEKKHMLDEELKEIHSMYAAGDVETYNELAFKETMSSLYQRELSEFNKYKTKPYFGKIIYEDEEDNTVYLGKKGITSATDSTNMLVVDWRAPISDVYYSNNLGKVKYSSPSGENTVDLKLKTTFEIKNGKLLDFYDSEIVASDDLLVKYLSKNKDVVLNEIIATIQEDQNKIIRIEPYKNVIVQGVAGSGKTTVALHRISYLLYNYPDLLAPHNFYIIASNELFLNYITSMLPDLDVYDINQGVLLKVILEGIKQYDKKFKCNFVSLTQEDSITYNTEEILNRVNECFEELEKKLFWEEVKLFDEVLISEDKAKLFLEDNKSLDIRKKAEMLDSRLIYLLTTDKEKRIQFILNNRNNPEIRDEALGLMDIKKTGLFEEDVLKKYKNLVNKYRNYFKSKVKKIKYMDIFHDLSVEMKRGNQYNINDLALILLILNKIEHMDFFESIKHIIIDEAQDLNVLIFSCLKTIFDKARFTIVGDVMQNIEPTGLHEWKNITEGVFGDNTEYRTLLKSYRNTIEISNFAKSIVENYTKKPFETNPVVRHGDKVHILSYQNEKDKTEMLKAILENLEKNEHNLNAIICKTQQVAEKLYERLKKIYKVELLQPDKQKLELNNYIVTLKDSKGLEFDGVIIWDFDDYELEKESYDYKHLYVAATRALHELYVYSNTLE